MSVKVLFWICGAEGAIGEFTQTKLFASDLPKDKYICYITGKKQFLDTFQSYIESNNFTIIHLEDVVNDKFDLVVLSEYAWFVSFNLSQKYSQIEKEVYFYILNLNVPILIFDNLGVYGLYSQYIKGIEAKLLKKQNNINLDKICVKGIIDYLCNKKEFINCSNCAPPQIGVIYPLPPYSFNPLLPSNLYWKVPLKLLSTQDKEIIKKNIINNLNIKDYRTKIVFFSISIGQYLSLKSSNNLSYYDILLKVLIYIFNKLSDYSFYLLLISPLENIQEQKIENVYIKHIKIEPNKLLPSNEYNNFLLSSDLVLTNNTIQNTFWYALCQGIPGININFTVSKSINLNDSKFIKDILLIIKERKIVSVNSPNCMIYNTRIGFLENPLYKYLLNNCELLDEIHFIKLINDILSNHEFITNFNNQVKNYLEYRSKFFTGEEIVLKLIKY